MGVVASLAALARYSLMNQSFIGIDINFPPSQLGFRVPIARRGQRKVPRE